MQNTNSWIRCYNGISRHLELSTTGLWADLRHCTDSDKYDRQRRNHHIVLLVSHLRSSLRQIDWHWRMNKHMVQLSTSHSFFLRPFENNWKDNLHCIRLTYELLYDFHHGDWISLMTISTYYIVMIWHELRAGRLHFVPPTLSTRRICSKSIGFWFHIVAISKKNRYFFIRGTYFVAQCTWHVAHCTSWHLQVDWICLSFPSTWSRISLINQSIHSIKSKNLSSRLVIFKIPFHELSV